MSDPRFLIGKLPNISQGKIYLVFENETQAQDCWDNWPQSKWAEFTPHKIYCWNGLYNAIEIAI